MTKEELAGLLNGRQYTEEITDQEEDMAMVAGLVVVFGGSDDLCEFRGAVHDETGAPGEILIASNGEILADSLDRDDEEMLRRHRVYEMAKYIRGEAVKIEALWGADGYSWTYKTAEPHATFDIMEDDEKFCRGIVFSLR